MRTMLETLRPLGTVVLALVLCACDVREGYERQIKKASHDIETAKNDAERATAYSDRGRGYSDLGRYLTFRKVIDHDEYLRLFALAMNDHDRAVALEPNDAETYFNRGLSFYDRAALANEVDVDHKPWFDAARADFAKAVDNDAGHGQAYDYLGLVDEQTDRFDEAIVDYTHEMAIDRRLGKERLAEVYCTRGQSYVNKKDYDRAAADLAKSIELGQSSDGCSCDPYNSLAYIYIDVKRDYDKGWDLVHKNQISAQRIAPEYVEKLRKASGRNG